MRRSALALNRGLAKGLMFVACATMVIMVLHIVADVFMRYTFNRPFAGTIEIVSTWYMVALAFLPLAYVQWRREHLIVELATHTLSSATLRVFDSVVYIVCIGVLVVYITQVTDTAMFQTGRGEAMETAWFDVIVWPTRWFLPVGLGAMGICMIVQVLTGMRPPEEEQDPTHAGVE